MNRLMQYLRRGLLVALMLMTLGGVSTAIAGTASTSFASASPAIAQVAVAAQPTEKPGKDQTTQDSMSKIWNAIVWTIAILAVIVLGVVIAYIRRRRTNANVEESEETDEDSTPENPQHGGDKPLA